MPDTASYEELSVSHPLDSYSSPANGELIELNGEARDDRKRFKKFTLLAMVIGALTSAVFFLCRRQGPLHFMSPGSIIQKGSASGLPEVGCGLEHYDPKLVLPANAAKVGVPPPIVVGNATNINVNGLPIDFTGIWWMKDNPVPEELLTFAGTIANSSVFPVQLQLPSNLKHMWSWDDSFPARVIKAFYAFTTQNADSKMHINFYNSTYGEIETALKNLPLIRVKLWGFIKINEDEWHRPTVFQKQHSIFSDTNYTLTRIIYGDGTPHPVHYKLFQDWMFRSCSSSAAHCSRQITVFGTNNLCERRCVLTFGFCGLCKMFCKGQK